MRAEFTTRLTPRQFTVLLLTAEALTDLQIAEKMGTTLATVKRQSQTVRNKIGADNRVAMAMYAVRKGLYRP
jgi:DNA-binding NarL/FixJ family response regulator